MRSATQEELQTSTWTGTSIFNEEHIQIEEKQSEEEEWKIYPSDTDYEASSLGRVRKKSNQRILKQTIGGARNLRYYQLRIKHRIIGVHRIIAETFHSNPLGFPIVDHINQDRLDNRAINLQWVTHGENRTNTNRNRTRKDKGKYKGVYREAPKWIVVIRKNGILYRFGRYDTEEEAAEVYNQHIHDFHPYSPLNVIVYG
jgi:hypothetical protein